MMVTPPSCLQWPATLTLYWEIVAIDHFLIINCYLSPLTFMSQNKITILATLQPIKPELLICLFS